MDSFEKLSELFSKFPGIGPRQARRFVYFLLHKDPQFLSQLKQGLENLKESVVQCQECFRFFTPTNGQNETLCSICTDPNVDQTKMLVLEKDADFENVQKSGVFLGKYFILGGVLPFLKKRPGKYIRQTEFLKEVLRRADEEGLEEIIVAFSLTPEGENTVSFLREQTKPIQKKYNLKISTLGRGFSTGTEVEYSDSETLKSALEGRQTK